MHDRSFRVLPWLPLLALAHGCTPSAAPDGAALATPVAAAATLPTPDPLVFDTWVPGPCSPNGQPQGQCPPGDLVRVRLAPVAEGLRSPRHIAFTPDGDLLITELAGAAGPGSPSSQGQPGH